jgi:hypothetical protein
VVVTLETLTALEPMVQDHWRWAAAPQGQSVYVDIIETWEHEDDADLLTAVCVAKRHGSSPVMARFSIMDAKHAGLWTKPGPWQTYPAVCKCGRTPPATSTTI